MIHTIPKNNYDIFNSLERLNEDECSFDIQDVRVLETKDNKNLICLEDYVKLLNSYCSKDTALAYILKENGNIDMNNTLAFSVSQINMFNDPLLEDSVYELNKLGYKVFIKPFKVNEEVSNRLDELCESAIENNDINILNSFLSESFKSDSKGIAKNVLKGVGNGFKEIYKDQVKPVVPTLKKTAAIGAGIGATYLAGKKYVSNLGKNWIDRQSKLPYEYRSQLYHKLSALYNKRRDLYYKLKHGYASGMVALLYDKVNKMIKTILDRIRFKQRAIQKSKI